MADPHKNFSYSTVATAPSPATSGTSLVVATGDGAKFPTVPFNATVWPVSAQPTTANAEIVRVTAISTDTLTITRAQEGTTARTVVVGDQIAATVTAKTFTDVELNVYVTDQDKTIPATTEVIFETYLELSASFFYELSTDAILVIGDFATPVPPPDQNTNIFVTVADETVPANSEIIFSDFYELSAPFTTEVAGSGLLQLGTYPVSSAGTGMVKLFDSTLLAPAPSIDTGAGAIAAGHGQLLIVYYVRGDRVTVDDVGLLLFNNDSGANYNWRKILLSNVTITGQAQTAQTSWETLWPGASSAANIFGGGTLIVTGYDSGFFPALFANYGGESDNAAGSFWGMSQGWYASTTAINRVSIAPSTGNLVAGSRLTIYGYQ